MQSVVMQWVLESSWQVTFASLTFPHATRITEQDASDISTQVPTGHFPSALDFASQDIS